MPKKMPVSANPQIPMTTLPDYLAPGLDLVLIGINPGTYSVAKGHYFARKNSRFWPAFSASRLSAPMREGLGVTALGPDHDRDLPRFGIGLTDVVKRPTANASGLTALDFEAGVPELLAKLEKYAPRVACFHGATGYRPFLENWKKRRVKVVSLGTQEALVGRTRLFVVPNPSPANAHFTPKDLKRWYDRLADFVSALKSGQRNTL
jgi:double-stranded uracil-DNA glycosylase